MLGPWESIVPMNWLAKRKLVAFFVCPFSLAGKPSEKFLVSFSARAFRRKALKNESEFDCCL